MTSLAEIWKQRLWVWLPALLFFLANLTAFAVYELGYAGNVETLSRTFEDQSKELKEIQAKGVEKERLLDRARANREAIKALYGDRFSTRSQRLTEITAEIKSLAAKAGLAPKSMSYPEQQIEDYGLTKRSFVFSVEGTYLDLRRFLNLLELSESFVTVENVALNEGSGKGPELHINVTLSTLFAKEPETAGLGQRRTAKPATPRRSS